VCGAGCGYDARAINKRENNRTIAQ
jgi:hypothetical protein